MFRRTSRSASRLAISCLMRTRTRGVPSDADLFLRGMVSTVSIKSIPVDMIVYDELDEATPDAKGTLSYTSGSNLSPAIR